MDEDSTVESSGGELLQPCRDETIAQLKEKIKKPTRECENILL